MYITVPIEYLARRLKATDVADVGVTAERFMIRLDRMIALVSKYDTKGSIELGETDAEMVDLYLNEVAPPRKTRQTKATK